MTPKSLPCPPPTDEALQERLRCVLGMMAIDGLILTRGEEEFIVRTLKGAITIEEFTRIVLTMARA